MNFKPKLYLWAPLGKNNKTDNNNDDDDHNDNNNNNININNNNNNININNNNNNIISLVNKNQINSTYSIFIYVQLAFRGHCLHFQVYTINSVI